MPRLCRCATLLTAFLLVTPAGAGAVSTQGTGEAVTHLLNVPHTEQRNPAQTQQSTDFELATLTVAGGPRTFAFAGSYYDGLDIIDVTDPAAATRVASYDCGIGQGDVQIFRRDGRTLLAYAQDDGYAMIASRCTRDATALGFAPTRDSGGTYIIDVSDPYNPVLVSFIGMEAPLDTGQLRGGSHNITVHPSGRYIYNSNADLMVSALPAIEIIDIADLAHPTMIGEFALKTVPGLGTESHDIAFSADGSRAYVAALSHGEILDTTDPANPRAISTIVDPAVSVWHQAEEITITDPLLGTRSFLIAEDEFAGAEGTGQCPSGGVHVYDISNESVPVKVGMFNLEDIGIAPGNDPATKYVARCTAHVFQIDRVSKLMTMGWYNAGVRILDLSALVGVAVGKQGMGIRQVGWYRFPDTDVWAAKALSADRGGYYFFGNDKRRGFDVYRYQPQAARASRVAAGRWSTPAQALAAARLRGVPSFQGLCFIKS